MILDFVCVYVLVYSRTMYWCAPGGVAGSHEIPAPCRRGFRNNLFCNVKELQCMPSFCPPSTRRGVMCMLPRRSAAPATLHAQGRGGTKITNETQWIVRVNCIQ